ncbi:MAG: hypothetical protein LUO86_04585 [Methanomicrobiales archaeon]|nr:hypothetical protein [Methanomicrobiales archaeon]
MAEGGRMDAFLNEYMERVKPLLTGIGGEAGHQTAFVFLSFKMGLYDETIQRCDQALRHEATLPPLLARAIRIIRERAWNLVRASYNEPLTETFSPEEMQLLAISPEETDVPDAPQLHVTNALILVYVAGLLSSPEDAQALEEQERFVLQQITAIRKSRR